MLKPRGQTGLKAKFLASASGPFGLGLKRLASASNFDSIYLWNLMSLAFGIRCSERLNITIRTLTFQK